MATSARILATAGGTDYNRRHSRSHVFKNHRRFAAFRASMALLALDWLVYRDLPLTL